MSWVRFDDKTCFHSKVIIAGNEAVGAWFRMTCWCADHLTDGHVPHDIALLIAGMNSEIIAKLCDAGLLDRDGDDYRVHDYLDQNPSGEEVKEERARVSAARKEAGRRGGIAKAKQTASKLLHRNEANDLAKRSPVPVPDPVPLWFNKKYCARAKILMVDPHSLKAPFDLVREYAKAAKTEDLPSMTDCLFSAYERVISKWDSPKWAPHLFVKHFEQVQSEASTGKIQKSARGIPTIDDLMKKSNA